jgi:SHS2 domain-containing protein
VNAARALTDLLDFPEDAPGESASVSIRLQADRWEDLIVDWLREILYRAQAQGFTFDQAETSFCENPTAGEAIELRAEVTGRFAHPGRGPQNEIKAVTYHGAVVEPSAEGYRAEFICDV